MVRRCFVCQSEEIRGEADYVSHVICSGLCSVVYDMWNDGECGTLSLKEAYAKEKAALEIADTIIGELLSDHGRLQ